MNRDEDRWRHCYWQQWPAIKKRWAQVHRTWRERAESGNQNKVRFPQLAVRRRTA